MPLPSPREGEQKKDWLSRCMGHSTMRREYPDSDQRYAVCNRIWDKAKEAFEGKEIRRVGDADLDARLDVATRQLPDSFRKRRIQKRLEDMRVAVTGDLRDIARAVNAGKRTVEDAVSGARDTITRPVLRAAGLGFEVVGLPEWEMTDEQIDYLIELIEAELDFWKEFMQAIEGMDPDRRAELYGGSIQDAFWRGFTMGLPSRVNIFWRLSIAEHCPDCLTLAAGSPYSKPGTGSNPLPTVPRQGDTRCLANCRCYLESLGPDEDYGLKNRIGVEVTALGAFALDPTGTAAHAAARQYQDLAEQYAWHIRMHVVQPAAGHDRIARQIRQEMRSLAESMGHAIRFTMTQAEMTEQVRLARAVGLRFVAPGTLNDDLVLAVATVISMQGVFRGTIEAVTEDPPMVTIDGEQYRLDVVGRSILFLER